MPDLEFSESSGFSLGFSESSPDDHFSFDVNGYDDEISFNVDGTSENITYDEGSGSDDMDTEMSGDPNIIGQHRHLSGRSLPDQHPMSAITGLLDSIASARTFASSEATAALNAAKSYADGLKNQTITIAEGMIRAQAEDDSARYAQLRFDVNGLATEVGIGGSIWTAINQNAHDISLKASAEIVNSELYITAGEITTKVLAGSFSSYITQYADEIRSVVEGGGEYEPGESIISRITQTAEELAAEVIRATSAETALSSRIQTADAIIQTVQKNKTVVNLLPKVYRSEEYYGNPRTTNGITFTVNADGSVTATGTASAAAYYFFTSQTADNDTPPVIVDELKEYRLSGCPEGGGTNFYIQARCTPASGTPSGSSGTTYKDEGSSVLIPAGYKYICAYIYIKSGYTCPQDGLTFWPMLETDPYLLGENLLPAEYRTEDVYGNPREVNGLKFTVNEYKHTVTVEGEATADTNYYLTSVTADNDTPPVTADPKKDYVLYGCPEDGGTDFYMQARCTPDGTTPSGSSGTTYNDNGVGVRIPKGYKHIAVYIHVASGTQFPLGGLTFIPVLHAGGPSGYQSSHDGTFSIYSKIKQTAEEISTEVARIDGAVSDVTEWKQTAEGFISTASSTLQNLVAGSRNLLLGSATKHPDGYGSPSMTITDNVTVSEWNCADAIRVSGSGGSYLTFAKLVGTSERNNVAANNQNYVFSVWIKNNRTFGDLYISANGIMAEELITGGETRRVVMKGSGNGSSVLGFHFGTASAGGAFDFTFWHPKIERGNIVSDWSPAPEDMETHIYESYIEQLSNKISLVVSESSGSSVIAAASIVAAINNQQSSVKINADHLSLTGYGTINLTSGSISIASTNFNVTSAGVITATNAIISGQITASSGNIGGWVVESERLYKEREADGVTHRAALYAPAVISNLSNAAFYIGTKTGSNDWDFQIRLQYDGKLIAKNAEITGVIEASSGIIGAAATNKITIGNNTTYASIYNSMTSLSDTTHNGFYLGADGIALGKGKFKVTSAGALTATSASITGSITATSGKIGGWTIESVRLYSEATDEEDVTYRAGLYAPSEPGPNNRAIYIRKGSDDFQFSVYYSGKIVAKNAEITGEISATSGYIGYNAASRIVIGTNSSYASIYSGMPSLGSSNNGFYIGTNGIALGGGKFKVTAAGELTATSGSISGSLVTSGINAENITTGYLAAARIEAGTITSGKLATGSVTTAKLDAEAVTAAKIAAGAITTAKLDAGAVTAAKIAAGAITADKIAANAITVGNIVAGTITADRINVGQAGGSGADARKTEWLTQINLAVSMALSDSQNFKIGNVRAYGYSDSLTFGFGNVGSGKYVRLYPAPKQWSDPTVPNARHSILIAFAGGTGQTIYGLNTSGQIVAIGAEQ